MSLFQVCLNVLTTENYFKHRFLGPNPKAPNFLTDCHIVLFVYCLVNL